METWEEEKEKVMEKELKGFHWRKIAASREKKGRAKGGLVLAVKEELNSEWEEQGNDETLAAIWRKGEEKWLWGITYMRHKRKENYRIMEEWIEKGRDRIIIINGDFNARTAREGGLWGEKGEKEERESKDDKMNEFDHFY